MKNNNVKEYKALGGVVVRSSFDDPVEFLQAATKKLSDVQFKPIESSHGGKIADVKGTMGMFECTLSVTPRAFLVSLSLGGNVGEYNVSFTYRTFNQADFDKLNTAFQKIKFSGLVLANL